jgi:hypothetical protein
MLRRSTGVSGSGFLSRRGRRQGNYPQQWERALALGLLSSQSGRRASAKLKRGSTGTGKLRARSIRCNDQDTDSGFALLEVPAEQRSFSKYPRNGVTRSCPSTHMSWRVGIQFRQNKASPFASATFQSERCPGSFGRLLLLVHP